MSLNKNDSILIGITQEHLVSHKNNFLFHKECLNSFLQLERYALQEGFEIGIMSSYRSFEKQKIIWNLKASGKRNLLNSDGLILDFNNLDSTEVLYSILRWSALPGMSRHHWGTDIDVFDMKSCPDNYQVQLIPQENTSGGYFYSFHQWLEKAISNNKTFGFFRPYQIDRNGVAPEMWHLSHFPTSNPLLKSLDIDKFKWLLEQSIYQDLLLIDLVKKNSNDIFNRFVKNIQGPQWP